jgi:hypothetical protein
MPDFEIGSTDEDGSHLPHRRGWPYSVYIPAKEIGQTDAVLCHGIQNLNDALQLLALCSGTPRPSLIRPQMFSWDRETLLAGDPIHGLPYDERDDDVDGPVCEVCGHTDELERYRNAWWCRPCIEWFHGGRTGEQARGE